LIVPARGSATRAEIFAVSLRISGRLGRPPDLAASSSGPSSTCWTGRSASRLAHCVTKRPGRRRAVRVLHADVELSAVAGGLLGLLNVHLAPRRGRRDLRRRSGSSPPAPARHADTGRGPGPQGVDHSPGAGVRVTFQAPTADRYGYSVKYLRGRIVGALGGPAAEEVVYSDVTTARRTT
jgi:hypothetical protein